MWQLFDCFNIFKKIIYLTGRVKSEREGESERERGRERNGAGGSGREMGRKRIFYQLVHSPYCHNVRLGHAEAMEVEATEVGPQYWVRTEKVAPMSIKM